jgi:hypothetical protein
MLQVAHKEGGGEINSIFEPNAIIRALTVNELWLTQ